MEFMLQGVFSRLTTRKLTAPELPTTIYLRNQSPDINSTSSSIQTASSSPRGTSRSARGRRAGVRRRQTKSSRLLHSNLIIGYWNVRGARSKLLELDTISERYDVLLLQETLLSTPHFFQLPGFNILRHDYGRGILIAVRDRPGLTWRALDCTDFEPGDYLILGVSVGDDRLRNTVCRRRQTVSETTDVPSVPCITYTHRTAPPWTTGVF